MIKYEVPNQLTGVTESANSWVEALSLKQRITADYMAYVGELHSISILIQNEDGSWTQSLADEAGNPIPEPDYENITSEFDSI